MNPVTNEFFISICVNAAILLLAQQTNTEVAENIFAERARERLRDVVSPFVDGRRGVRDFQSRNTFERKDYKDNWWWKMIVARSHHDVRSTDGRDFRDNFRVPASFFDKIVQWFRDNRWHVREFDLFGRPNVPLELKILACFEMLGSGVPPKIPARLIGCNPKTIGLFFTFFVSMVSLHLYKIHIKFPSSVAEIRANVSTYAEENLPGCMGSIDCVHVPWPKALASQRSWFVGKEGVPTVAFQVIVNHNRKILSVSRPHPGAHNDKTIASMDSALHAIRTDQAFVTFPFQVCTSIMGSETKYGVYLICDGGYHIWRVLQRCNVVVSEPKLMFLMSRIASARKDVECTFGIVKSRFRILKVPMLNTELSGVNNIFTTCCIFHNMLLDYDNGEFADAGMLNHLPASRPDASAQSDFSGIQAPPPGFWLGSYPEASHIKLRSTLADHLYWSHANDVASPAHRSAPNGSSTPNTAPRR
jgi:hypothetical protein